MRIMRMRIVRKDSEIVDLEEVDYASHAFNMPVVDEHFAKFQFDENLDPYVAPNSTLFPAQATIGWKKPSSVYEYFGPTVDVDAGVSVERDTGYFVPLLALL